VVRRHLQSPVRYRTAHLPVIHQASGRVTDTAERKTSRSGKPIESPIFSKKQKNLRWSSFKDTAADQMFATVRDGVFPFIKTLGASDDAEGSIYSQLRNSDTPSLAWFVKSMVGMERIAAQAAFAEFLNDRSLNA